MKSNDNNYCCSWLWTYPFFWN